MFTKESNKSDTDRTDTERRTEVGVKRDFVAKSSQYIAA